MPKFVHTENDITTTYHVADNGRTLLAITQEQDCEAVIDANKRMQNGEKQVGPWRLTAQIPPIFILMWLNEEWARGNIGLKFADQEFDQIIFKKLRDPDYKWLRAN